MEVIDRIPVMRSQNNHPPESLIGKIEEIANICRTLSRKQRELTRADGLYVGKGILPGGAIQYLAGGKFTVRLVFVRNTNGSIQIKKYKRGDWEFKVEEALQLCRSLKEKPIEIGQRAYEQALANGAKIAEALILSKIEPDSRGQRIIEKSVSYEAAEAIDPYLLSKVSGVYQEHFKENNEHWHSQGPARLDDLRTMFLNKLNREWPVEYQELITHMEEVKEIKKLLHTTIIKAYITGYMHGKGWITSKELNNVNLHLGETLAGVISNNIEEAQFKRISFTASFAEVSAMGADLRE